MLLLHQTVEKNIFLLFHLRYQYENKTILSYCCIIFKSSLHNKSEITKQQGQEEVEEIPGF
ncbi:hypothetical protein KUTeg_019632 [Tegillarca granosa]|uniref:Uncharacterized protein n=1 Tax=Tegillarca granosa TaxID=220873 RepID=A0ABQ9EHB6_TEGGR|nr:hypothetical protein KUTeg_019632 [Tegillarca granosa]